MYVTIHAIKQYLKRVNSHAGWMEAKGQILEATARSRLYDHKSGSQRFYDDLTRAFYVVKGQRIVTVEEPFWLK